MVLYGADPTQEAWIDHEDYTSPTRQHELQYIIQIMQIIQIIQDRGTNLPCLADLDHGVGIDHTDHLAEVWVY